MSSSNSARSPFPVKIGAQALMLRPSNKGIQPSAIRGSGIRSGVRSAVEGIPADRNDVWRENVRNDVSTKTRMMPSLQGPNNAIYRPDILSTYGGGGARPSASKCSPALAFFN